MSTSPTTHVIREKKFKVFKTNDLASKHSKRLVRIDNSGRVYIPALIRKIFAGYHFYPYIENGKIVLDPIKVDDVFSEEVDRP